MLGYMDMTWCSKAGTECANTSCSRYLTDEHRDRAVAWWGDNDFPAWYADMQTKDCGFKEIKYVFSKTKERDIKRSTEDTKGH